MMPQEALLRLMSIGPSLGIVAVVRTSDGFYLGQQEGDLGYNAFIGRPPPPHPGPGRDMMLETWAGLTADEKRAVLMLAYSPVDGSPIPLAADFGVPVDDI